MRMSDKSQHDQREKLKLKVGDFAYFVTMGQYFVPTIVQVKITGDCDEGSGYEAIVPETESYKALNDNNEFYQTREIHTCNYFLLKTLKEAREYGKKLINNEIQTLKEQQSVISRNLNQFIKFKNHSAIYVKYEEVKNENT